MIKILIIIDNLNRAGAQRQILEFIKGYNRDGLDITLCSLDPEKNYMLLDFQKERVRIATIEQRGKFNIKTLVKLYKLIRQEKFDIVHTYLATADYYGRVAAILARTPKIITSIRSDDLWKKWHHLLADRILNYFTDTITINANRLSKFLIEKTNLDSKKIVTIHNGITIPTDHRPPTIDLKKEFGISNDALVVGMIARFSEQKDYGTFFEAAKIVAKEMSNVYFLAVGDGEERKRLEAQYAIRNTCLPTGTAHNIIFTGLRNDALDIINTLDVMVLTSIYEGLPNVIMEAMAMKKCVVATNVGGCAELVDDGTTGYLTEPKDYKNIASKILRLLKDADLRKKMGEAGFAKITEKFNSKIMISKSENLYRELMKPKVAFIMPQFPRYDETFILREILELKNQGLDMLILSLRTPKDLIVHEESKEFLNTVINLPFFFSLKLWWTNLCFLLKNPIKHLGCILFIFTRFIKSPAMLVKSLAVFPKTVHFAKIAKKNNVKLAYGYWATTPCVSAIVLSRLLDIPYSFTGHAHDIYTDTTGLKEKIEKAKFILTCTADNKRHLLEVYAAGNPQIKTNKIANKIIVNYHGLDLERFSTQYAIRKTHDEQPFKILSVGSLLPCKGFDVLIEACKILKNEGINFECAIAGGGPLEEKLKRDTHDAGLDTHINFTGYITQDKLIPLYQQASIFALPVNLDIHWGIPNVLLEAMACEVPVITAKLPSIAELIEDGKNGLIIPEKNPKVLAESLSSLYKNETSRKTLGAEAKKVVQEKFDIKKNARNMKEILTGYLSSRSCVSCNSSNSNMLIRGNDINNRQDVLICNSCGLTFLEGASNGRYYDWESKTYWRPKSKQQEIYEEEKIALAFKEEFQSQIKKIDSLVSNRGNLLDVGCGRGKFLGLAKDDGWNCFGLDVSEEAVSHVKNKLKIEAFCESIKDSQLPSDYFDVVTMWDVLEHLQNPVEDLKTIHNMLKSDGVLAIKTPNEKNMLRDLGKFLYRASLGTVSFHLKYMYYSPHYYYYSPQSLERILRQTGFQLLSREFDQTNVRFAQAKIKQHYSKFKSSKWVSLALSPRYEISESFNMKNKMVVYAKKI